MYEHECIVCGRTPSYHDQPDFADFFGERVRYFLPPCCKGCPCQTYQEALAIIEKETGTKYIPEDQECPTTPQ